MKVLALGVSHQTGTSKGTGNPYTMARLMVATPTAGRQTDNYTRRAAGYEPAELELEPESFPKFEKLSYPCELHVDTDTRIFAGKLVPVVTGFKAVS